MMHPLEEIFQRKRPFFPFAKPLAITWHENRSSFLAFSRGKGGFHLKIHRLFIDAPLPVLEAVIDTVLYRLPSARKIVKKMAHRYFSEYRPLKKTLESKGKVYDLKKLLEKVFILFPERKTDSLSIGWMRARRKESFSSMTFGLYDPHHRCILIHPLLDDEDISERFLLFTIYHELLHRFFPVQISGSGRRIIHPKEFRMQEKRFPLYHEVAREPVREILQKKSRKSHGGT